MTATTRSRKSPRSPRRARPVAGRILSVRAIERAIDVLEVLVETGPASLHQLHVATGLSKSTVRRVLATLVQRRFVRQGLSDGMYRSNVATPKAIDSDLTVRIGRLVEVARPHMMALTEQVRWPSDLHIYANGRMRILESTHGLSPFGRSSGALIDSELNMFAAASGLAFLAAHDDAFALGLAKDLENDEFWSMSRFGLTPVSLVAELRKVRRLGVATRLVTQGRRDGRDAIAVRVDEGGEAIGALTITWPRQHMAADDFIKHHLPALRATAGVISEAFSPR